MSSPFFVILVRQDITEDSLQGKRDAESERNTAVTFQLDRHTNIAVKMLSLDPNLAKIHARLISHMSEKTFWYNYFSRIAVLRADANLEPLCEDLSKVRSRLWGLVGVMGWVPRVSACLFVPSCITLRTVLYRHLLSIRPFIRVSLLLNSSYLRIVRIV